MRNISMIALLLVVASFVPASCLANSGDGSAALDGAASESAATATNSPDSAGINGQTVSGESRLSQAGIGFDLSSLGPGLEVAVPLTAKSNIRVGFNMLSYNYSPEISANGAEFTAGIGFRSVSAFYDWFPFHGKFHLSPGVLVYNGNHVNGTAAVEPYNTFNLGSGSTETTYTSDPNAPVSATWKVPFGHKAAPALLFGKGNLSPRNNHHFSFSIEAGIVFEGAPTTDITLSGSACDEFGNNCVNAATDPGVQANLRNEQQKLNAEMSTYKFYPIISLGFGWKL